MATKQAIQQQEEESVECKVMQVSITDGYLVIKLPLEEPEMSKGGKMMMVGSTHGFTQTGVKVNGKPLSISAMAGFKA